MKEAHVPFYFLRALREFLWALVRVCLTLFAELKNMAQINNMVNTNFIFSYLFV